MLSALNEVPRATISVDSTSELELLASQGVRQQLVLRLRPDYQSHAVVMAGSDSRFGVPLKEVARCREIMASGSVQVIGFHVFSGSQVLQADAILSHLRGALDLSLRAAEALGIVPNVINLGGGFGVPYGPEEKELDLVPIGKELESSLARVSPARIVIELGRYLVAPAGWYLTKVIAQQTHGGRVAVVVDGGTHQRADLCGLGLRNQARPPLLLSERSSPTRPTDVLGCLSLPTDVLAESCELPAIAIGDVLAFANAGAYGLGASPHAFHAHVPPAEVAFEGNCFELIRERSPARDVLIGQSVCHTSKR